MKKCPDCGREICRLNIEPNSPWAGISCLRYQNLQLTRSLCKEISDHNKTKNNIIRLINFTKHENKNNK